MDVIRDRAEISKQYTWNSESLFMDRNSWRQAADQVAEEMHQVATFQGSLSDGPGILLEGLQARDRLIERLEKVLVYAGMSHTSDTTDQEAAAMDSRADSLYARAKAEVAFFEPEIVALGADRLQEWIEREPALQEYRHYLDDLLRKSAHLRSAEIEELLSLAKEPFASVSTTVRMMTTTDMEFEPAVDSGGQSVELTQGSYDRLLRRGDRELRKSAWEHYADSHLALRNSLASNLITSVKQSVFEMRARRFDSTLASKLFDDNIPAEVFHNLIETFKDHRQVWHRYFGIRRQILGVDTLRQYDIWAPLQREAPQVPFEQAVEWICAGLAPLGQEYVKQVRSACLQERWIDVYPSRGKVSGAFSYGARGTYPFIMMNYTDTVFSMSTLAHELGHSMHSYLTWTTQPQIYSDYSLFAAEVASNFHQAMVRAHLLESLKEPSLILAVLEEAMSNFHRYFLIMPTLAILELEVHKRAEQGEGLTEKDLSDRLLELYGEAYGPSMQLEPQRSSIEWAYYRHLYADYYVFQYATGIAGAHALSRHILDGQPGAVEDYLTFLRKGGSEYPLDALAAAGVDLTSSNPVVTTFEIMAAMVDRIEQTASQIEEQAG